MIQKVLITALLLGALFSASKCVITFANVVFAEAGSGNITTNGVGPVPAHPTWQ